MNAENPYATPKAVVVKDDESKPKFGSLKFYTDKGRIGRLRYILYSLGLLLLTILLTLGLYFIPTAGPYLAGITALIAFLVSLNLTIQRCHDFNRSSIMAIMVMIFIPIAGMIFFFIPGSKGKNKYGLPPPPNTMLIKYGAVILGVFLLVLVVSIMV